MDGILIINKPAGMTSHDVVFQVRKRLKIKKIGHSGTLDPNATGVLLLLVGKATKILPFIEDIDKEYIATMELGRQTISDDIWGETINSKEIHPIDDFAAVLASFVGKIKQTPPRISSIKINGKKLYEYTRNNEMIELPLRDVEIYETKVLDEKQLKFKVHCSSGTYIRSLCVDIAKKTDNLGCMSSLVRSKVGRFTIEDAIELDTLSLENVSLYPIESMLDHMDKVVYTPIEDIYHGKRITLIGHPHRVCIVHDTMCIAIYEQEKDNVYRSVRGLW